ncbi:hypothetical protein [Streptomyces sp. NPDC050560]|uniref:hypothetical protein n=1 Tax=Streptomyces sp. NPDC050560 TaxID=3365630 RepID=UPI00379248CE
MAFGFRRRRGGAGGRQGSVVPGAEVCVVCHEPIQVGEKLGAVLEEGARARLDGELDERALLVDPKGNRRYAVHLGCLSVVDEVCALCLDPVADGDRIAGVSAEFVREHTGAEPDRRAKTTDPLGNPCFAAHAGCAESAGAELKQAPAPNKRFRR